MKIDETVNKYLITEGNRKDDFAKWVKVVNSCKTVDQLNVAIDMGKAYYVKYGETFWGGTDWSTPTLDKIQDTVENKSKKLKHEEAQKLLKDIKKEN